MKNYNTYQLCRICSCEFFKTRTTGNMCDKCRRRNVKVAKAKYHKKTKEQLLNLNGSNVLRILAFVDKVKSKSGFIYTLNDLNDLYELWSLISPYKQNKYDRLPTGLQLNKMWLDLLDYTERKKYM